MFCRAFAAAYVKLLPLKQILMLLQQIYFFQFLCEKWYHSDPHSIVKCIGLSTFLGTNVIKFLLNVNFHFLSSLLQKGKCYQIVNKYSCRFRQYNKGKITSAKVVRIFYMCSMMERLNLYFPYGFYRRPALFYVDSTWLLHSGCGITGYKAGGWQRLEYWKPILPSPEVR